MTTVLVVEDELPLRILYRVNLEAHGFQVIEAPDGPSGLEKARRELPDLILLDVMMPGLDGWHVAEELQDDSRTRDIPFVFLTPFSKQRDRLRGFELGAVDYVTLPFNPADLAPLLEELLGRLARGEREEMRREKIAQVKALKRG